MVISEQLKLEVKALQKFVGRAVHFRDVVIAAYQSGDRSTRWVPLEFKSSPFDEQFDLTNGLCYNLRVDDILIDDIIDDFFESWQFFSGDLYYPVPCVLECGSVDKENSSTRYNMGGGKYKGLYGEYRIHLLNHCIRKARERIIEIVQN